MSDHVHPSCRATPTPFDPDTIQALVGTRVAWDTVHPLTGVVLGSQAGTLRDAIGRNLQIDDRWLWVGDLANLRPE